MSSTTILYLIFCTALTTAVQIPFVSEHVTLVPKSNSTSVTLTNRTCDECLCASNSSHSILNCFPNNSCQFFVDVPLTYSLQSTSNAFLYFPQQVFPNASQCCMSNTSFLLDQLTNTTTTNVSVDHPLSLLLDDHNYLATVSYANKSIVRFYPDNLTQINQPASPSFVDNPRSLAYHEGAYFVGFKSYILVVLSNNMTQIHNISASVLDGVRDMVFLRNGQLMIVSSADNDRLSPLQSIERGAAQL